MVWISILPPLFSIHCIIIVIVIHNNNLQAGEGEGGEEKAIKSTLSYSKNYMKRLRKEKKDPWIV